MNEESGFTWGGETDCKAQQLEPENSAQSKVVTASVGEALMTTSEAAQFLRITPKGLRAMALKGKVKFYRVGRGHRYKIGDLELLLTPSL